MSPAERKKWVENIVGVNTKMLCHVHGELKRVTGYRKGFVLECGCIRPNVLNPGLKVEGQGLALASH